MTKETIKKKIALSSELRYCQHGYPKKILTVHVRAQNWNTEK